MYVYPNDHISLIQCRRSFKFYENIKVIEKWKHQQNYKNFQRNCLNSHTKCTFTCTTLTLLKWYWMVIVIWINIIVFINVNEIWIIYQIHKKPDSNYTPSRKEPGLSPWAMTWSRPWLSNHSTMSRETF